MIIYKRLLLLLLLVPLNHLTVRKQMTIIK